MDLPDPWPLRALVLGTPRLELRPDDDAGLVELAAVAHRGIHPPDRMPFSVPWTDADPRDLGRNTLAHFWAQRTVLSLQEWGLHFLVRHEGAVVGVQSLLARDFAVTRAVASGSWLGLAHQGVGIGTEMRAAVLCFAFDHLGATVARSSAFADNVASRRVSEKLGYRADGSATVARRGVAVEELRTVLRPEDFARPPWTLRVEGYEGCAGLLGRVAGTSTQWGQGPSVGPGSAT